MAGVVEALAVGERPSVAVAVADARGVGPLFAGHYQRLLTDLGTIGLQCLHCSRLAVVELGWRQPLPQQLRPVHVGRLVMGAILIWFRLPTRMERFINMRFVFITFVKFRSGQAHNYSPKKVCRKVLFAL